jgi:uncharacterized protein YuzE
MSKAKVIPISIALLIACAPHAIADKPPAKAKKLDAAGITKLYDGAYASFDNVGDKVKGEIFYSLKDKVLFGIYRTASGDSGIFRGKARVKGDQFCYKTDAKEVCQDVYLDGDTFYEANTDGTVTSIDTVQANPPNAPTSAAAIPASTVLELVKGKRILVKVYDSKKPLVADVKWEPKKSCVVGKYIFGGEPEGKVNVKFKVKGDKICFANDGGEGCYTYYGIPNGFIEVTDKGKVHAISTY